MIKDIRYIGKYKKGKGIINIINTVFSVPFLVVLLYRFSNGLFKINLYPLSKIVKLLNYLLFHIDIDPRASLLGGVYIPHPINIVIGDNVYISGNAKIMHGSTLGGNLGRSKTCNQEEIFQPHFYGNAYIGINSTVIGPIDFYGNTFIAATSLVTKGEYKNCLVTGNESRRDLSELLLHEMRV